MDVSFKDFYGQYINVNDETASGNIRMRVNTMKDLNLVRGTTEKQCDTETDISLDRKQLKLLVTVLQTMLDEEE